MNPGEQVPVGRRIARFLALLGVVGAISAGVVISRRLSDDSLALLIGLACGVAAMLPTLVLGIFLWRRDERQRRERELASQSHPSQLPVIIVTPQAMSSLPDNRSAPWQWTPSSQQRNFTILGESDDV